MGGGRHHNEGCTLKSQMCVCVWGGGGGAVIGVKGGGGGMPPGPVVTHWKQTNSLGLVKVNLK